VPRLFGAYEHGTLILEDLSPARSGSQVEGCTVKQAQDVLLLLAEIHGRFWGDPRVPPFGPERFAGVIDYNMKQCWEPFQHRYGEMLGDAGAAFEWMWRNAHTVSAHRLSAPTTLFHGDVHAENLLFVEDRKRGPVLIDWQLAGQGLAANDVSFFLVKSLTVEERRENEAELLQGYWEGLPEGAREAYSLDRLHVDYCACLTRSMVSAAMLVGPRFAERPDRYELADVLARRVIAAAHDLKPVEAYRALT
jgi:Ser/Thr protein kinase RdoA (MazF antagonist)